MNGGMHMGEQYDTRAAEAARVARVNEARQSMAIMLGATYELPPHIVRNIHYSINPTPAQRRARDLESHKQMYYWPLETISNIGEEHREFPDGRHQGEVGAAEGMSFHKWLWNPKLHHERGEYGTSMLKYLGEDFN
jgi:hypothetical protein